MLLGVGDAATREVALTLTETRALLHVLRETLAAAVPDRALNL